MTLQLGPDLFLTMTERYHPFCRCRCFIVQSALALARLHGCLRLINLSIYLCTYVNTYNVPNQGFYVCTDSGDFTTETEDHRPSWGIRIDRQTIHKPSPRSDRRNEAQ